MKTIGLIALLLVALLFPAPGRGESGLVFSSSSGTMVGSLVSTSEVYLSNLPVKSTLDALSVSTAALRSDLTALTSFYSVSNDTPTATTSVVFIAVSTMTVTLAAGNYMLSWNSQVKGSQTNKDINILIEEPGGEVFYQAESPIVNINDWYQGGTGFKSITISSPSSHTYTYSFHSQLGMTATITNTRLFLRRIN